jgi:hypothetical protein
LVRRDRHGAEEYGVDLDVTLFFALTNAIFDAGICAWSNKRRPGRDLAPLRRHPLPPRGPRCAGDRTAGRDSRVDEGPELLERDGLSGL